MPVSDAASRRIEHRVAGADANPYLLAALDARRHASRRSSGSSTRARRWTATPTATRTPATLPAHWPEALAAFERSDFARDCLGERFARLYAQREAAEMQDFNSYVSPLEYAWYLTTALRP